MSIAILTLLVMVLGLTEGAITVGRRYHSRHPRYPSLGMTKSVDPSLYELTVNAPHPKTAQTALRHCETWGVYSAKNVVSRHTAQAFEACVGFVDKFYQQNQDQDQDQPPGTPQGVILDSGCGQGLSTLRLARQSPHLPVIGIDRSFDRLSRNVLARDRDVIEDMDDDEDEVEDTDSIDSRARNTHSTAREQSLPFVRSYPSHPNLLFVRAEISDFWQLSAANSSWSVHEHHLLYPNPYPKAKHLHRRFHGHPNFPLLLCLGGKLRLRSNWKVYCDEMEESIKAVVTPRLFPQHVERLETCVTKRLVLDATVPDMTHFERKYRAVGLDLFETRFDMDSVSPSLREQMLDHLRLVSRCRGVGASG